MAPNHQPFKDEEEYEATQHERQAGDDAEMVNGVEQRFDNCRGEERPGRQADKVGLATIAGFWVGRAGAMRLRHNPVTWIVRLGKRYFQDER